ncbi:unnamed protein product, partial [Ectocarpus sp. 6 AP-2014]
MCSPEPGRGGGGRGTRGGGRRNHHGGGGGSSGGGGLSEFWSCLDPKQRDSLLTINGKAVRDALDCDLCRDLVSSATFALEEETKVDMQPPPPPGTGPNGNSSALVKSSKKKPPKHSPKPTA